MTNTWITAAIADERRNEKNEDLHKRRILSIRTALRYLTSKVAVTGLVQRIGTG